MESPVLHDSSHCQSPFHSLVEKEGGNHSASSEVSFMSVKGQGLGCGYGIVLLEEFAANHTIELPELTQDREIDCWRAQQEFVYQDPEKGRVTPQQTVLDLPEGVQKFLGG